MKAKAKFETGAGSTVLGAVIGCGCKHAYQDGRYGRGMRLHCPVNKSAETGKQPRSWRCTVCGTEHTANEAKASLAQPAGKPAKRK